MIPDRLIPATYTRRIPYLYSAAQISDLMTRSAALLPPLLGVTMAAFIGLIAATGLRGGEAIALDSEDFLPAQALLTVTGKYGRQRVLPLHPTTVAALITYRQVRATMTPHPYKARSSSAPPANGSTTAAPKTRSDWSPTPATCPPTPGPGPHDYMTSDIPSP